VVNRIKGPPAAQALEPTETVGGGTFTSHALEARPDDIRPEHYRPGTRRIPPPVRYASHRSPPPSRTAPRPAPTRTTRTYIVQPNDSLARIARRVYGCGDRKYYTLIYEANKDKLPDIETVRAGQVLTIPSPPGAAAVLSGRFGTGRARRSVALRPDGTR